ncbi:MAG: HEPN domain-containing protein [Candidatus Humimicrobiaceae bacterium]
MKKNKEDIMNSWMEKADRDLEVANRELKIPDPLTDIICFHAQQSAEKYMKAYLIFLDIEFQKTHDIEDLVAVAGKKDPLILEFKDIGAELSAFAVEARYPEFEEPSLEDTENAVEIARKFKKYIINRILKETKDKNNSTES